MVALPEAVCKDLIFSSPLDAHSGQISERELRRQRKENQAIFQLMMIVGSFMLGYVPICGKYELFLAFLVCIFFKCKTTQTL